MLRGIIVGGSRTPALTALEILDWQKLASSRLIRSAPSSPRLEPVRLFAAPAVG
jgi:hypothetical protein